MSGKIRSAVLIGVGVAVAVGAILWRVKRGGAESADHGSQVCGPQDAAGKPDAGKPVAGGTGTMNQAAVTEDAVTDAGADEKPPVFDLDAAELEAQRVVGPLQEDLDSDDPKVIAAAARQLMGHTNHHVRLKAVEGLAWAENEGFADLTKMLLDATPEVSRAALEAWALKMQMVEATEVKAALLEEVGPVAIKMGAEAFQEILDAMFDLPDAAALNLLKVYAAKTEDADILEKIIDGVNFRAQPEDTIETKDDIPRAIKEFLKREAEEAKEDAVEES